MAVFCDILPLCYKMPHVERSFVRYGVCMWALLLFEKKRVLQVSGRGGFFQKNKESDSTVTLSYLVSDASYHSAIVSFTSSIFVLRCFIVWIMKRPILIFSLSCGKRW